MSKPSLTAEQREFKSLPESSKVVLATILGSTGRTGVQTYVNEVSSYLMSRGYDTSVVTPWAWGGPLVFPVFGARRLIERLSASAGIEWHRRWHYVFLKRALKRELADENVSLVLAQCALSARAALEARSHPSQKVVIVVHSDGSQADEWVDKEMLKVTSKEYRAIIDLERRILPEADGVVYVSEAAHRSMEREVPALASVPSSVITSFIGMPQDPQRKGDRGDLITVGTLEIAKNHEYLLRVVEAANRHGHRYTLDIVGDGICRRPLEKLSRSLHLQDQVRFLGCRSDVRDLLPHYKAYVHASTRESLCLAIIEAMACRLGVVAGAIGGIPELFEPGTEGLFWPLDDPDASAEILIGLIEDEETRYRLGDAARLRFERSFDASTRGLVLEQFLASVSPRSTPESLGKVSVPESSRDLVQDPLTGDPTRSNVQIPAQAPINGSGGSQTSNSGPPKEESRPSRQKRGLRSKPDPGAPRQASKRALVTTIDQGFSSASNFLVGVAVARISGPSGLGGFALAYGCWTVLAALHRSLVTDPMAIENDAVHPDAQARLSRGFASEVTLGLAAALCLLVVGIPLYVAGQHTFGLALLAVTPWLPFLLVQDYWRWTGFMRREPGKSLMNDTVFNIVQGACFLAVALSGVHSVVAVIASWGAGATVGAFYGLWQFKVRATFLGGFKGLRARWHLSKWLAANSVSGWASTQASVLFAGFILGPAGLGALRATQTLVTGPALVLIQAGGSVGLPEASRALAERGWPGLKRVSMFVSIAGMLSIGLVGAAVVLFGGQLLQLTYGPEFARYWPAAELFAVAFLITSVGLGPILILKTSRNTRSLFRVQLVSLVASLTAVTALAFTYGVTGTAGAAIAAAIVNVLGLAYYTRRARAQVIQADDPTNRPSEDHRGHDGRAGTDGVDKQPGPLPDIDQIRNNDTPIAVEFG